MKKKTSIPTLLATLLLSAGMTHATVLLQTDFSGRIFLNQTQGLVAANQEIRVELRSSPLSGESRFRKWWQRATTTDSDGRFRFEDLAPGVYSVKAVHNESGRDILDVLNVESSSGEIERVYEFGD